MKPSLKNFPSCNYRGLKPYCPVCDFAEWKEAFEIALRAIFKECSADPYMWYCDHNGAEGLILEILGEEDVVK